MPGLLCSSRAWSRSWSASASPLSLLELSFYIHSVNRQAFRLEWEKKEMMGFNFLTDTLFASSLRALNKVRSQECSGPRIPARLDLLPTELFRSTNSSSNNSVSGVSRRWFTSTFNSTNIQFTSTRCWKMTPVLTLSWKWAKQMPAGAWRTHEMLTKCRANISHRSTTGWCSLPWISIRLRR